MTATDVIFDGAAQAGPLPLANGDLLVLLADAEQWTPDPTDATIDDVTDELTGGGYAREAITATVDRLGDRWHAWPDSTPSIDHGAPGAVWVVVARDSGPTDADRTLVRATLVDAPTDPLEPSWPDGLLTITVAAGVEEIQPGAGVTVDATDPARPVVSAAGGGGSGLPSPIPGAAGHLILSDGAGDATWTAETLTEIIDDARSPGPWIPLALSPAADPGVSAGWAAFPSGVGAPPPLAYRVTATGDVQMRGGVMWLDATGNPAAVPAAPLQTIAIIPPELAPDVSDYGVNIAGSWSDLGGGVQGLGVASVVDIGDVVLGVATDGATGPIYMILSGTWEPAA